MSPLTIVAIVCLLYPVTMRAMRESTKKPHYPRHRPHQFV